MKFLYAAYAVTWLIHIAYLATLARGYSRLRDEIRDLQRK
jgi:CcmD family protein